MVRNTYKSRTTLLAAVMTLIPAAASAELRVNLDELVGFSTSSKTKIEQAANLLETILNSDEFKQAVLAHQFEGKTLFSNNDRTLNDGPIQRGLTNEQVYEALMAGAEQLKGRPSVEDSVANLELHLYTPAWYKKWSVVGYGYPGQANIYMNWYYFNSFNSAQIIGNLVHEWIHKLGFDHDYGRTARRPCSVPYAIGDIVARLGGGKATEPPNCEKAR